LPGETILIVEDDVIISLFLETILTRLGYVVLDPVASGEEAIAAVAAHRPDLVLMDIRLSGKMDGITAAERIQAVLPVPVVYLTGYNVRETRLQQIQAVCLSKPIREQELTETIERLLHPPTND